MKEELDVHCEVSHQNIVRIFELLEDDNFIFIVSEKVYHGSLHDLIYKMGSQSQEGIKSERDVAKIIKQIILALNYMHQHNIVHRDIKPKNILIDSMDNLDIKLADFGFAAHFDHDIKSDHILGTSHYIAPEIIKRIEHDSKVDIWSSGIVTYLLLTGLVPFTGEHKDDIYRTIVNDELKFNRSDWKHISKEAKDFVVKALLKDHKKRPSAEVLLKHPWLNFKEDSKGMNKEALNLDHVSKNLNWFCQAT